VAKRWMTEEQLSQLPPAMTARSRGEKNKASKRETSDSAPPSLLKSSPRAQSGMQAMRALGRLKTGEMNNAEQDYANHLELLRRAGEVLWYEFEPMKLNLAPKTTYTPDFLVQVASGHLELHEVKGFWTDDARVKIKVAAKLFPVFKFVAIQKEKGEQWKIEEF